MRQMFAAGVRAVSIAVLLGLSSAAEAQSFLQSLFGGGQQQRDVQQRPMSRPGAPAVSMPSRSDGAWSREIRRYSPAVSENSRASSDGEQGDSGSSSGKYRTLCVRTCDGYYFPIANAVSRSRFMRDAAQCRASCGDDARLFYHPAGSDNVSTMLDLAGRSYLRMPTAFKYRKSLTDGCSCRPMPWSAAETQRHQQYAQEAARLTAEAEAKRVAAESAEAARTQPVAAMSKPVAMAAIDQSAARATIVDHSATSPGEVAVVSDANPTRATPHGERLRASSGGRATDRPAARRQQAVVRSGSAQGGANAWFPTTGGSKYTWPGDAPRR
ncbi:MAG: DUF2865 domain-containing protein [Hyphomicrobium sp.]